MATATLTSNPTVRRLMKEAHELSAASPSPSPYFYAHPVSDSDLFDWHFTIAGPPAPSPYAGGIYHGRIVLPRQYPLRPPSFRFLTPSGRFEVNREICLSISGHHEETWQPAWGLRTALLALRSLMEGDPKGQVGGVDAREDVRREWARRSKGWKCDVCSEGKTNEEALREWRVLCKGKGVSVDEAEDGGESSTSAGAAESLPTELRFGYRGAEGMVEAMDRELEGDQEQEGTRTPDTSSAHLPDDDPDVQEAAEAVASLFPDTASPSGPSASSSTATHPRPSQTTTTTTITPFPRSTQPSRATPQSSSQTQTQTQTQFTRRSPQDSTAWMDGAIPILAVALLIMVLKKWIFPYLL